MKVSIMQPNLFMWNGLLKQLCDSDIHIILDHVKGSKNSRYNRNRISGNKSPCWLTMPMKDFSRNNAINTIMIDTSDKSNKKNLDLFSARYSKAPFFKNSNDILSSTITTISDETNIIDLYKRFLNELKSKVVPICKTILSSEILSNEESELLKGVDLVNNLIKKVSGTTYLAAQNTESYANAGDYIIDDIKIQRFIYESYCQDQGNWTSKEFINNLSCLDTLSFMSVQDFLEYLDMSNSWSQL